MFDREKLDSFTWINVANPDHEDFERLLSYYKIEEDTISDILDPDEQSRIESEDNYRVIIVRFPIMNRETDTAWHTEPLSIIYTDKRVLTISRRRCDVLDRIKPRDKTSREIFILNVLCYIAESYLKSLKELNRKVVAAKKNLQKRIIKKDLLSLLEIENSYTLYMSGLKGNMGVIEKLDKMRSFTRDEDCDELLEDVRIELNQATEVITSYSKMLQSIKETFESVINMDSNTYINRLTILNTILMIPTIIVGYYGMNIALPFAQESETAGVIFFSIIILLVGYIFYFMWQRNRSK